MSADIARSLELGKSLEGLLPPGKVDLLQSGRVTSLSTTTKGNPWFPARTWRGGSRFLPQGSSVTRGNTTGIPSLGNPAGGPGSDRFKRYGGEHPGFVLVGRSLAGTEKLESHLGELILEGWGISVVLTFAACLI